jgi:hypothetical protein
MTRDALAYGTQYLVHGRSNAVGRIDAVYDIGALGREPVARRSTFVRAGRRAIQP